MTKIQNKGSWATGYYLCGAIFLAMFLVFLMITINDVRRKQLNSTQIPYLAAVLTRGIGYMISGSWIQHEKKTTWNNYSVICNGLPGYVVATCYCFIFFSWCTVCVDCLAKKKIRFFDYTKIIMTFVIVIIWVAYVISLICFYALDEGSSAHNVEGVFATIRDWLVAVAFITYLIKIHSMFNSSCSCDSTESTLFFMCTLLFVTMTLRGLSILIYITCIMGKKNSKGNDLEWTKGYFTAFLLEQLLLEIFPLGAICVFKLISTKATSNAPRNPEFDNFEEE